MVANFVCVGWMGGGSNKGRGLVGGRERDRPTDRPVVGSGEWSGTQMDGPPAVLGLVPACLQLPSSTSISSNSPTLFSYLHSFIHSYSYITTTNTLASRATTHTSSSPISIHSIDSCKPTISGPHRAHALAPSPAEARQHTKARRVTPSNTVRWVASLSRPRELSVSPSTVSGDSWSRCSGTSIQFTCLRPPRTPVWFHNSFAQKGSVPMRTVVGGNSHKCLSFSSSVVRPYLLS